MKTTVSTPPEHGFYFVICRGEFYLTTRWKPRRFSLKLQMHWESRKCEILYWVVSGRFLFFGEAR